MSPPADAARTAANVLLRPIELGPSLAPPDGRALLVGSRSQAVIEAASRELHAILPGLTIDPPGAWPGGTPDLVCLLLTGEPFRRERSLAVLSGASTLVARGANGQWYRLVLPPFRPWSLRWWARFTLCLMLCRAYTRAVALVWLTDALRRLLPPWRTARNPGAPANKTVTFIVPTYNQRDWMDFCLPPLLAEAGDRHTVMIVDDASADDTSDYVRSHYPQVRVLRLPRNQGFGGAVSAGIAASDTPLFSLINTDVKVRPGYLAAILPHFDRPDTFAVCSRIDLPDGSQMETGNVAPDWSGVLEPYHVSPARPGPILYAGGASSVFDRAKYEALGGFEVVYRPLYFEDIELGYRAWRRGWRSLFEPGASVFHQRRAWIGARFGNAFANESFLRNGLLFVLKNVRDPGMLRQHLAYVCARLLTEVLAGDATMAHAVLRALPYVPSMLVKRWCEYRRGDLSDRRILELARPPSPNEPAEAGAG